MNITLLQSHHFWWIFPSYMQVAIYIWESSFFGRFLSRKILVQVKTDFNWFQEAMFLATQPHRPQNCSWCEMHIACLCNMHKFYLESFNYCSLRQCDKLYLDIFVFTQPTRYSDKFIVVQMELSQVRYVVKRAIFNWRNTVEAETQSGKKRKIKLKNMLNLPT